jgi:GT2 family glycosyltransferase
MEYSSANAVKVSVVIVTYGKRWPYLYKVLHRLEEDDPVTEIYVIDNACLYDVSAACAAEGFSKTIVISSKVNVGSAGGFSSGIALAMEKNADFIFLLDDDNLPQPGTLRQLLDTYLSINQQYSGGPLAVMAYRKCQYDAYFSERKQLFFANDDFMGFNLFNSLQRHTVSSQKHNNKISGHEYFTSKRCGPFSGLLLPAQLIRTVGLPRQDMVIYYDDVEWVIRILNAGGTIWLDTETDIEELNANYAVSVFAKPVIGMVLADSESKIYYLVRNRTYIDNYIENKAGIFYTCNKFIFLGLLLLGSLFLGRLKRMMTVLCAYCDGSKGRLGMNSSYLLP